MDGPPENIMASTQAGLRRKQDLTIAAHVNYVAPAMREIPHGVAPAPLGSTRAAKIRWKLSKARRSSARGVERSARRFHAPSNPAIAGQPAPQGVPPFIAAQAGASDALSPPGAGLAMSDN
jgi:hypothetical protein